LSLDELSRAATVRAREIVAMTAWPPDELRELPIGTLDERYRRYRLVLSADEQAMARSLARYGQVSPIVVCLRDETAVVLDGFKRLQAARRLRGFGALWARRIEVDERSAKAAVFTLNQMNRRPQEWEEAWLVQALVREDDLSQAEVAELLGRHKSWVCRRLALVEKLAEPAKDDLRLGLLSPTQARELVRLPAGNQVQALAVARRESLTAGELQGVVDLLLSAGTREKEEFVLAKPREALREVAGSEARPWDPRLSVAGNRVNRQLAALLDQLARMENWLRHRGRGELRLCDRGVLCPGFQRLGTQTPVVAELVEDFLRELHLP
jgi:ParB-like chromosome segregation protein Spo0J